MSRTKGHFTDEIKREAVRPCNEPGANVAQIAHGLLDIDDNVLRRSVRLARDGALEMDAACASVLGDGCHCMRSVPDTAWLMGTLPVGLGVPVLLACPNEATAKRLIAKMQCKKMIHNIRALKGGLDAWEKHGFPVEPLPADLDASRDFVRPEHGAIEGEYTVRAMLSR